MQSVSALENDMIQISACKNGDKEALGALYRAYAQKLLDICRHYVKEEEVAEDLLHDAFVVIFNSIGDLREEKKIEGWMITIVRNLCLKYLQSVEHNLVSLSELSTEIQDEPYDNKTPTIDLAQLLSAIDALPKGNREVFRLSVLDGLSHQEIGALLGISPHSSSSQLSRAKKMLRAMLTDYRVLLLLPILLPLYLYFLTREKAVRFSENSSAMQKADRQHPWRGAEVAEQTAPASGKGAEATNAAEKNDCVAEKVIADAANDTPRIETDSVPTTQLNGLPPIGREQNGLAFETHRGDSTFRSVQIVVTVPSTWMVENHAVPIHRPKYPWTFNLGYASNAGASGAPINLNYLSLVDYAKGGAVSKLYTWADLQDYYNRNNALMDSVERARLALKLQDHAADGNTPLGEVVRHHRPRTVGLSLSKQLSPRWFFGTGVTYTRLVSEFESEAHRAKLKRTQKIDYVGVPLRLTYNIWNRRCFSAYATGGVTFETPIRTALNRSYVVSADSSYTQRGNIKARPQWSTHFGVGIQYRLAKPLSLYLEPNVSYYFGNGSALETYRTEHPFFINVPFGLRLTW